MKTTLLFLLAVMGLSAAEVPLPAFTNSVGLVVSNAVAVKGLPQGLQYSIARGGGVLLWEKVPEPFLSQFRTQATVQSKSPTPGTNLKQRDELASRLIPGIRTALGRMQKINTGNVAGKLEISVGAADNQYVAVTMVAIKLWDASGGLVETITNAVFITDFAEEHKVNLLDPLAGDKATQGMVATGGCLALSRSETVRIVLQTRANEFSFDLSGHRNLFYPARTLTTSAETEAEIARIKAETEEIKEHTRSLSPKIAGPVELRKIEENKSWTRWSYRVRVSNGGVAQSVSGKVQVLDRDGFELEQGYLPKIIVPTGSSTISGVVMIDNPSGQSAATARVALDD